MENPFDTLAMMQNSKPLQQMFFLYFLSIFFYNMLAVLVTFMLNSVWHAILDNFRPITVWGTDLFIFYYVSSAFGEEWTVWSWMQLGGMCVLLYGTAIYNAPNAGSIKMNGEWFNCGIEFDYSDMEGGDEEQQQLVKKAEESAVPYQSPYQSPFMTPGTLAKRRAAEKESKVFNKVSKGNRGGSFA